MAIRLLHTADFHWNSCSPFVGYQDDYSIIAWNLHWDKGLSTAGAWRPNHARDTDKI
jgi:hypothetical protein